MHERVAADAVLHDPDGHRLGKAEEFLVEPGTSIPSWALVAPTLGRRRFSRAAGRCWVPLHAATLEDDVLQVPFGEDAMARAAQLVGPGDYPEDFLEELQGVFGDAMKPSLEETPGQRGLKRFVRPPTTEKTMTSEEKPLPASEGEVQRPRPEVAPLSDAERAAVIERARRDLPLLTKQARRGIQGLRRIARS